MKKLLLTLGAVAAVAAPVAAVVACSSDVKKPTKTPTVTPKTTPTETPATEAPVEHPTTVIPEVTTNVTDAVVATTVEENTISPAEMNKEGSVLNQEAAAILKVIEDGSTYATYNFEFGGKNYAFNFATDKFYVNGNVTEVTKKDFADTGLAASLEADYNKFWGYYSGPKAFGEDDYIKTRAQLQIKAGAGLALSDTFKADLDALKTALTAAGSETENPAEFKSAEDAVKAALKTAQDGIRFTLQRAIMAKSPLHYGYIGLNAAGTAPVFGITTDTSMEA